MITEQRQAAYDTASDILSQTVEAKTSPAIEAKTSQAIEAETTEIIAKTIAEKTAAQSPSTKPSGLKNSLPTDLIFPPQLSEIQRENSLLLMAKHNVIDQAQLLLDALAARFSLTTWQNIRNPMAYFTQLIRSYQAGQLDMQYAEAIAQKRTEAVKPSTSHANKKRRTCIITSPQATPQEKAASFYQQAVSMAKHAGCSLREMAQELQTEARLEAAGYDLGSSG